MIEGYCTLPKDHHFKETTYTNEEYDGTGTAQLILRMYPVTASQAFSIDERDTTLNEGNWETIDTELYFVDNPSGVIDANFTLFKHWNAYRVTYSAGYATIPADLAEACATLAAFLVDNGVAGTSIKRKEEGQRKIEYFDVSTNNSNSLIQQLNLDETLNRYSYARLIDDV